MDIKFTPFPELKSERLALSRLNHRHTQALFDYQSNKENFKYVDMPIYSSIDQAIDYINKMNVGIDENKFIIWAICLQSTNEIIGTVSIWNINQEENSAELGYGLFPAFRRKGYMKEALNAVLNFAFEIMKLIVIKAYTSYYNKPSNQLLVSMNFSFDKTIEDEYSNGALMNIYQKCI